MKYSVFSLDDKTTKNIFAVYLKVYLPYNRKLLHSLHVAVLTFVKAESCKVVFARLSLMPD